MRLIKLTDQQFQTYGGCQWGENVTHTASGEVKLCGPGFIHAYTDAIVGILMNPVDGQFESPVVWEADGDVVVDYRGLKVGCARVTTLRIVDTPVVTTEQRAQFAILCARQVSRDSAWFAWSDGWLKGNRASKWSVNEFLCRPDELSERFASWAAWTAASDFAVVHEYPSPDVWAYRMSANAASWASQCPGAELDFAALAREAVGEHA